MNATLHPRSAAALLGLALLAAGCPSYDGSCESSALCDEGTFCYDGRCVAALPAGSCTPPAPDVFTHALANGGSSGPGSAPTACVASNPATWPAVAPPLDAGAHLGEFGVGETVSFTVPPGTASVTIHQQGVSAAATFGYAGYAIPNSVVPTALKAPNGGSVFSDDITAPLVASPYMTAGYYGGFTPRTGSFTLPATSRFLDLALSGGSLPAGSWSFRVNDWNVECAGLSGCTPNPTAGRYDVSVIARPGPYVSTGTLDVAIYIVTNGAKTAATAVADPAYARFAAGIGRVLGQAGICVGTVTLFDVPAWARGDLGYTQPNIDGSAPCGDLSQIFALASPSVDGVHLFLVDKLVSSYASPGTTIVGIDGSIPGPSGVPGAATSGAAMGIDGVNGTGCVAGVFDIAACHADQSAYIAAHEIGHWLGLYHTTEASGDQMDPLIDTPTCSCRTCGAHTCDGSSGMSATACVTGGDCAGGDNLMFWLLEPSVSRGRLTAQQGLVMRVNPAVK